MKRLKSHGQPINMRNVVLATAISILLTGCATTKTHEDLNGTAPLPANSAIYEIVVKDGVSYQEVVDSLNSISAGMNFVNPANFPIAEHMKARGIDSQGIKEVHSFCNLSLGTEIFLDHPEFLVFAPCRIALYEKPDANQHLGLYLGLDRPTYDLKSIHNPTPRAQKAAQELEDALIQIMQKASQGDF